MLNGSGEPMMDNQVPPALCVRMLCITPCTFGGKLKNPPFGERAVKTAFHFLGRGKGDGVATS